jgi:hypothetical protein
MPLLPIPVYNEKEELLGLWTGIVVYDPNHPKFYVPVYGTCGFEKVQFQWRNVVINSKPKELEQFVLLMSDSDWDVLIKSKYSHCTQLVVLKKAK